MTTEALVSRLRAAGCVFAEEEAALLLRQATDADELERMVAERVSGTPLEYVLGWADFAGIHVPVDAGVFVPRPRSELLVDSAVGELAPGSLLLDLCCGTGAIAAAVASRVDVEVFATDIDPAAVANARRTLADRRATVLLGDLFEPLPKDLLGRVKTITMVAPYVPTADIALLPHEARDYEPLTALDGGTDGLDVVRRAIAESAAWLEPAGCMITEVAEHQVPEVARSFEAAGLRADVLTRDESYLVRGRARSD